MKNKKVRFLAMAVVAALAVSLSAYGTAEANSDISTDVSTAATANLISGGAMDTTDMFTDRDLEQEADLTDAEYITVTDGQDITLTEEGVYVLSGSASEVTVTVEAGDEDKVQIVLDGVTITNTDSPCIYVKSADKVFVTTTDSDNSLSVTGMFTADGDTNTDAVIFSKDDLVLNGVGTLNINSTDNGVSCKDELKITGGTINVNASSDAFEANDQISIADGYITVTSGKDAFHSENDEDNSVGYIYICGGTFTINAADDGIQATSILQIDGGNFNITSEEGIEGTWVQINGGTIKIYATDDGANASIKSTFYDCVFEMNDGSLTIAMGQGDTDAIDSNGRIIINGGTIDITAQSPFDYDYGAEFNGGTITVNGQQITEITNSMMGGGFGPMGGFGDQNMGGGFGGTDGSQNMGAGQGGMGGNQNMGGGPGGNGGFGGGRF